MSLKILRTFEESAKVPYIARGSSNRKKPYLAHDISSFHPTLIRVILSMAATLKMKIFLHEVSQVYLQLRDSWTREFYLQPGEEDKKKVWNSRRRGIRTKETSSWIIRLWRLLEPNN